MCRHSANAIRCRPSPPGGVSHAEASAVEGGRRAGVDVCERISRAERGPSQLLLTRSSTQKAREVPKLTSVDQELIAPPARRPGPAAGQQHIPRAAEMSKPFDREKCRTRSTFVPTFCREYIAPAQRIPYKNGLQGSCPAERLKSGSSHTAPGLVSRRTPYQYQANLLEP